MFSDISRRARTVRRALWCAAALALALVLGGLPAPGPARAATVLAVTPQRIADNIPDAVAITSARDGSGRLFITLKSGKIMIYDGHQVLPQPFLDISALVASSSFEQGLLSVVFHPSYQSNGTFYIDYTSLAGDGDTVIARYHVSAGDPNVADPASATTLLTIDQPYPTHNGGQLQFGPDGYLYVGMGDGGNPGDPQNRAQNMGVLLGKILRIDVDGAAPYAIPSDNPFVSTAGARPEIWALGLRNPWRFSFDRATGDMFIGDVGQNRREEVDYHAWGAPAGQNFGWRLMEGSLCYNPPDGCTGAGLTAPILEYPTSDSPCGAVVGGYRYRGSRYPELAGVYIYGDYCTGQIWGATPDSGGVWRSVELFAGGGRISSFGEDEAGELYFADPDRSALYRIVALRQAIYLPLIAP